jgi:hypothetical protein
VRWRELFDDLDGQLRAAAAAELDTEADDRARLDLGRLGVVERLARADVRVDLTLVDGTRLTGGVVEHGIDWLVLASARGHVLVPVHGLAGATCGRVRVDQTATRSAHAALSRLGLRTVLRDLVRRRGYVRVGTVSTGALGGTLDAVGADHVELAVHDIDVPRRSDDVREVVLVPFASLCWVRYVGS